MHSADRFVPSYFRLESHLRESIRTGALRPGGPIPPESSLCQQFGVSRTTVRQALSRLVYDGLIERHRGRGSFVAEPRLKHTQELLSFEEEMRARGAVTGIVLLRRWEEPAAGRVAESLLLLPGAPVMGIERQRLVNSRVVGYELRYLPREIGVLLSEEEIRGQPLVPAVQRVLGKPRTRVLLRVTASVVRLREAKILGAKTGMPVLVREHTWYVEPDRPDRKSVV
jgi:GntR family transcriptional regulator